MSAALSGRSGSQCGMGGAVLGLVCESRGHGELDATHAGAHKRADLEQLEADGAAGGAGELSMSQADAALAAPAVACRPGEVLEAARRLASLLAVLGRFGEFGFDRIDQPAIARQA